MPQIRPRRQRLAQILEKLIRAKRVGCLISISEQPIPEDHLADQFILHKSQCFAPLVDRLHRRHELADGNVKING
jgi:hypothetical protein